MLEFSRVPYNEFETNEEFRLNKNRYQDIVVSNQVHIDTQLNFKEIRIYSKTYNVFTKKAVRLTKSKWFEFLCYVYEIKSYDLDHCDEEEFKNFNQKYLFKMGNEAIKVETSIYKGYWGVIVGEFINNEPSSPNLVWFPVDTLDDLIEKSNFCDISKPEDFLIDIDNETSDEILIVLEKLRNFVETILKDSYGEKWWDKSVSKHEGKALDYYISDTGKIPAARFNKNGYKKIWYLDIKELGEVITDSNNWQELFKTYFDGKTKDDRNKVNSWFGNYNTLRQCALHKKPIDECLYYSGISGMRSIKRYVERFLDM